MSQFVEMFSAMFSYDPADLSVEQRNAMADILRARSDMLRLMTDVLDVRAQAWAGVPGATDLAEIKAQDLAMAREIYVGLVSPFFAESIDFESLSSLLPMVVAGVLQSFVVPLPVVLEAIGLDVDNVRLVVENLKKLVEDM